MFRQRGLDRAQAVVGVAQTGAQRRLEGNEEFPLVLLGQETLADVREEIAARMDHQQGERHHLPAMIQRQ